MTSHCQTDASALADDQVRPAGANGGEVVRYRLDAAEIEWELAAGRTVLKTRVVCQYGRA
jgi:hypothetical protein